MPKIFVSWSGEKAKAVGAALNGWLPHVLQEVEPWYSPENIRPGQRWLGEISGELASQAVALFCVTADSVVSPWLNFEAGAIAYKVGKSSVIPYLVGLKPHQLGGHPLSNYQAKAATKEGTKAILAEVHRVLDLKVKVEVWEAAFETNWPALNEKLQAALKIRDGRKPPTGLTTDQKLDEILGLLKSGDRLSELTNRATFDIVIPSPGSGRVPETSPDGAVSKMLTRTLRRRKRAVIENKLAQLGENKFLVDPLALTLQHNLKDGVFDGIGQLVFEQFVEEYFKRYLSRPKPGESSS